MTREIVPATECESGGTATENDGHQPRCTPRYPVGTQGTRVAENASVSGSLRAATERHPRLVSASHPSQPHDEGEQEKPHHPPSSRLRRLATVQAGVTLSIPQPPGLDMRLQAKRRPL